MAQAFTFRAVGADDGKLSPADLCFPKSEVPQVGKLKLVLCTPVIYRPVSHQRWTCDSLHELVVDQLVWIGANPQIAAEGTVQSEGHEDYKSYEDRQKEHLNYL